LQTHIAKTVSVPLAHHSGVRSLRQILERFLDHEQIALDLLLLRLPPDDGRSFQQSPCLLQAASFNDSIGESESVSMNAFTVAPIVAIISGVQIQCTLKAKQCCWCIPKTLKLVGKRMMDLGRIRELIREFP
jgi:hypothetical protein